MTPEQTAQFIGSPSSLILYGDCAGAWAAEKIHKEKPTDRSYPLDWGGLFHDVREDYNHHCYMKGVGVDLDVMKDIVDRHFWELIWTPKENPRDEEGRPPTIPDTDYEEFLDVCEWSARSGDPLDLDHLYGIEEWLWMDVNGYRFRGRPDIVFVNGNRATIPDYKTSRVIMTDKQLANDFKSQCYAALLMDEENCPQVDIVRVTMEFARYGHTSEAFFSRDHAERVKEEIYQRIQRLEADMKYECTPGDWCSLCRRRSVCEALTHAIAGAGNMVKVVVRQDQAEFILGEIKLFGVALDNRRKKLAEYAAHTPVVANGMCYGPREHRGRVYDADELYKAYDGTESGPFAMLSADGRAIAAELKRKKKREPDVDLAALGTEKVTTRMELYKVEKPAPKEAMKDEAV